jgi:DNA replication protein DnaC
MRDNTKNYDALQQQARRLSLWGLLAHWSEIDAEVRDRLIAWEDAERRERSLHKRLGTSRIGRFKSLADFDWAWPEHIDRAAVEELMTLDFMSEAANPIFVGPNGVGKTMIARNIAHRALLAGHSVRFTTASEMLSDLGAQDSVSARQRRLRRYTTPGLLVIDELGYLSYDNRYADLLFEVVSTRYEKRSTLISTNRVFQEWGEVFPNAACVVTLVDRLTHCAEIINIKGESYRLKEAKERTERKAQARKRR